MKFNKEGELQEKVEENLLNRPSDPLYKGEAPVICAFCRENNKDEQ